MRKIFVGLSGGVDSAVSAALLKEQGHEVVGAFIKIWSPEFLECTWREDRLDAMRVCATLGIPFREIDLSREYREEVVGDMIEQYRQGITPNPDVLCNRRIKFGAFSRWALTQGAEMIATGHYARIEKRGNIFSLLAGKDATKDQSYFLYRLGQEDLARTLFPIGEYEKGEVRALARKFDLPVAVKPDSQGLCFAGDISMPEFLARFISLGKGPIINEHGERIGEHDGAALYTIGQRHGLHIARSSSQSSELLRRSESGPYFVIRVDTASNTVFVSSRHGDALAHEATLRDTHWIEGETPDLPLHAEAVPRYHAVRAAVTISDGGDSMRACFTDPQLISPGQSLVFYEGERCLGGGIVDARE